MTTRVALYMRVSTKEAAEKGYSLPAQRRRLMAFARSKGWRVTGFYSDPGHSGRTTRNRPGYRQMMAEMDKWDVTLVLKMDRIHRNARNFAFMMDDLRQHGKEFASVTESLDTTTAMGRFVMDILQRIAQLEIDQLAERVTEGMEEKATTTKKKVGSWPIGYDYDPATQTIRPNKEWKRIISWIYKEYVKPHSSSQEICDILNDQGILKRTRKKGAKPKPWQVADISRIIANPANLGHDLWRGHVRLDLWKPLVGDELFWRAQTRRTGGKTRDETRRAKRLALVQKALRAAGRPYQ